VQHPAKTQGLSDSANGFNPHRPRRAGATAASDQRTRGIGKTCFNPHRPRRAGATIIAALPFRAIFTGFNPHRPRRAGATIAEGTTACLRQGFNPHRPRRAGATLQKTAERVGPFDTLFQSSPAPKSRCNALVERRLGRELSPVSILTGPEEPVQPAASCDEPRWTPWEGFNPHRPRRAGATGAGGRLSIDRPTDRFNPHRPRRAGATSGQADRRASERAKVSILTGPEEPVQPTRWMRVLSTTRGGFQSSPAPKSRCNWRCSASGCKAAGEVSILTGPEEPVQRGDLRRNASSRP